MRGAVLILADRPAARQKTPRISCHTDPGKGGRRNQDGGNQTEETGSFPLLPSLSSSFIRFREGARMTYANQTAVITGASSGIGWALAKVLAAGGCKVGLVAR